MTALDDVLKTEQEAENLIQAATTAAAEAVIKAKATRKDALATAEVDFTKRKEEQLGAQAARTVKTVESIEAETAKKITSLQNTFSTKKAVLINELRKTFIK